MDFGGVLTTPLQDAMIRFSDDAGIELQDLVRAALGAYAGSDDSLVTEFETGRISEDVFSRAFAARLTKLSGKPVMHEGLVRRLFGSLHLEEDMVALVGAARAAGYKTALPVELLGHGSLPTSPFGPAVRRDSDLRPRGA